MRHPQAFRRTLSAVVILLAAAGVTGWLIFRPTSIPYALPEIDLSASNDQVRMQLSAALTEVANDPESAETWGHLGTVLLAQEFDSQALDCFDHASQIAPTEFRWHYLSGLSALATDRSVAAKAFQAAVKISPHDSAANQRLGELLLESGEVDRAKRCLETALAGSEQPARSLQALARTELTLGNIERAERYATEALKIAPNSRMTLEVLSAVLFRSGRRQEAQQLIQTMHAVRDEPLPWNDPYAAAALAQRVEETQPPNSSVGEITASQRNSLIVEAERLIQSNNAAQAVSILQNLDRQFPDSAEILFRLGVAFTAQKQWQPARETFQKVVSLMPEHDLALYNLGISCRELGDDSSALLAFEEVLIYAPENSRARLNKAQLQVKHREFSTVRQDLEIILKQDPGNTAAHELLQDLSGVPDRSSRSPSDPVENLRP